MKNQEAFNRMVIHLHGMKKMSLKRPGDITCAYRGENNSRCVVGSLIPDDQYDPKIDEGTTSVSSLKNRGILPACLKGLNMNMLVAMQGIHDNPDLWSPVRGFVGYERLGEIAKQFNLEFKNPKKAG